MKTGRPRKPTNLKLVTGTLRKDRQQPNEPQPEIEIPQVPAHLSDEAKVEWGRISQQLAALGILTTLDRGILAAYCQAWARWVKAEREMAKIDAMALPGMAGELMTAPSGYLVRNEWLNIANKAMEQVHKFGVELGLSAPARSRINVKPKDDKKQSRFEGHG